MNGYITLEEAAEHICKCRDTVRYMCKKGKIRYIMASTKNKIKKKLYICKDDIPCVDVLDEIKFVPVATIAQRYGVTPQAIHGIRNRGHTRWIKIRGIYMVYEKDCDEYYQSGKRYRIFPGSWDDYPTKNQHVSHRKTRS